LDDATSKGDKISVEVVVQKQQTTTVNQLGDSTKKEDLIVDEFRDVFPDDLPGITPDRDIEFIIELLPRTAPILSVHIE
jgi:predicted transcriptional regulator